jgi:ribosomal protein L29
MDTKELRGKTKASLVKLLKQTQEDVEKSVTEVFQGKSKDTSKTKKLRREIARIKTVLSEKEILAEKPSAEEEKDAKENI